MYGYSRCHVLKNIKQEITAVSTKVKGNESILFKEKSLSKLSDDNSFFADIYAEMSKRTPLFLDVITTCLDKDTSDNQKQRIIGAVVTVYSIILFTRNPEINAFQRMLTAVCIRGRAEDMNFGNKYYCLHKNRLNRIGITLCARSKLRLLEEASQLNKIEIVNYLKNNPLMKITGDNLDVFIRTGNQAIDIRNKDLHLFASNAISTRIARPDMDTTQQPIANEAISGADMFLKNTEFGRLESSYVILVWIFNKFSPCHQMKTKIKSMNVSGKY
ncbi:hypothetical protein KUTeg_023483 [Tegillarca granosa]|uniref:Uncharacterized protein n=1 Tax=Tegillarca granosa TaxID=220873 RepID=A0ABQ9E1T1_TEGGR|nr:hypothetical protein KUTeg_023483 [Tegillarca granosa]